MSNSTNNVNDDAQIEDYDEDDGAEADHYQDLLFYLPCAQCAQEGAHLKESVEKGDRKQARFLGVKISSGRKKYWGLNSGNGGNTRDGGKTIGGAIGAYGGGIGDSLLVALYACMTFIYGSSWKGKIVSEAKRSLDKSSEGSEEVFPGEAGE
ncbi:hypothetical protein Tco_0924475 [Tanacetum coccineum]|uniref:Uncharacterized protein n=1 Tax=Tanacetum coccineum TaxID=301880 RepID=A0ABQ5D404_9ASTR